MIKLTSDQLQIQQKTLFRINNDVKKGNLMLASCPWDISQ